MRSTYCPLGTGYPKSEQNSLDALNRTFRVLASLDPRSKQGTGVLVQSYMGTIPVILGGTVPGASLINVNLYALNRSPSK